MADNINVTPGTGSTIAADDIGGVLHQRVKLTLGADGTSDGDVSSTNPLPVSGSLSISGTPTVALDSASLAALENISVTVTSSSEVEVKNDSGSPIPVSASSLPLPTGAATETTLSSLNTKTPALGQALMAASSPVVIASNQSSIPVTGTFFQATQPVSAASLPLPTGAATETTLSNLNTKVPSNLTVKAASTAAVATDPALVVAISPNNPVTATISNASIEISNDAGNPLPVNGTVTANIGTTNGLALDTSVNSLLKPASTLSAVTTVGTITNAVTVKADTLANQANPIKSTISNSGGTSFATVATAGDAATGNGLIGFSYKDSAGNLVLPQLNASGEIKTSDPSGLTVLNTIAANTGAQSTDTLQTGTITALNGTVVINAQGSYTVSGIVSGTFVGTVVVEGLMADGTTWQQLPTFDITNYPYLVTFNYSAATRFIVTGGGYTSIRVRASAFTSGTINVALNASLAQQSIFASQLGTWSVTSTPVPNNLGVTAVGTTGAAVTATLPAPGAGLFHYIDSIEVTLYSTAARTGSATPITCTTTNMPGSFAYTWATAAAIGTADTRQLHNANRPIKSSAANTATTIVCPAVTGGIWRINVVYSTGT